MARSFSGTNKILNTAGPVVAVGTTGITMAGWFNAASFTGYNTILQANITASVSDANVQYLLYTESTTGKVIFNYRIGGVSDNPCTTTTAASLNTWSHACCTMTSGRAMLSYLNAGGVGTKTAPTVVTATGMCIGCLWFLSAQQYNVMNGRIADTAIWNTVLTVSEISALASGIRPNRIRPASLVFYCPLDGLSSPEPDLSGNANNGTLTGTAYANGPPVTMFTPKLPTLFIPSVAPPSILYGHNIGANFTRKVTTIGY